MKGKKGTMLSRRGRYVWLKLILLAAFCHAGPASGASAVWKVTRPDGKTLYLGGSVHLLHKSDHPLPAAFHRAFDASTHLAFEVDGKALTAAGQSLAQAGEYRKGDSLKNHVDPRTYAYVKRVFELLNLPEETFARYRPWAIVLMLQAAGSRGLSHDLGVDQYFMNRAAARKKPVVGLESIQEHASVFSGLNDREAEVLLIITFIPNATGGGEKERVMNAWRRGDAEALARMTQASFVEFPAFGDRILGARNRAWLPKIESFLGSGQTYFVVVGAAHIGGRDGLLPLLRARGYRVEQL